MRAGTHTCHQLISWDECILWFVKMNGNTITLVTINYSPCPGGPGCSVGPGSPGCPRSPTAKQN